MTKIYKLSHEELAKILAKHFGITYPKRYSVTYNIIKDYEMIGPITKYVSGIDIQVSDEQDS